MKGRLAALACFAAIAFGQRADSPPAAAALNSLVTDAVALDASGRPVTDLTAKDFEVVRGGVAQKITRFTWFDTRLHTAVSRADGAEQLPALDLLPDEIRRNLVVVVDDLGLSPDGIHAVRTALRTFVAGPMGRGDHIAILCSSGGTGMLQQLTDDTRTLTDAIEGIRYLGGGPTAASAARAYWLTLGYALEGVRYLPGRKAIVVFSEHPGEPGPWDLVKGEAARAAHLAGATVYAVNPLAAASHDGEARRRAGFARSRYRRSMPAQTSREFWRPSRAITRLAFNRKNGPAMLRCGNGHGQRDDFSRDLHSGQVGRAGRRRVAALALHDIGPVDARGLDADQHFILAGLRNRPNRGLQLLRARRAPRFQPPSFREAGSSDSPHCKSQKGGQSRRSAIFRQDSTDLRQDAACSSGNSTIW